MELETITLAEFEANLKSAIKTAITDDALFEDGMVCIEPATLELQVVDADYMVANPNAGDYFPLVEFVNEDAELNEPVLHEFADEYYTPRFAES